MDKTEEIMGFMSEGNNAKLIEGLLVIIILSSIGAVCGLNIFRNYYLKGEN